MPLQCVSGELVFNSDGGCLNVHVRNSNRTSTDAFLAFSDCRQICKEIIEKKQNMVGLGGTMHVKGDVKSIPVATFHVNLKIC